MVFSTSDYFTYLCSVLILQILQMDKIQREDREKAVYDAYKKAKNELYDETPKEMIPRITKSDIITRAMTYETFPWSASFFTFNSILNTAVENKKTQSH